MAGALAAVKITSQPWARYPGVEDWLMFDAASGALLHLHVHYRLVTGLKRVKHLILPWDELLLKNSRKHRATGWPVPAAEMELLILAVRIWAKMPPHRRLVAARIPDHICTELDWLRQQVSADCLLKRTGELELKADAGALRRLVGGGDDTVLLLAKSFNAQLRHHFRMSWGSALVTSGTLGCKRVAAKIWEHHISPARIGKTLDGPGCMIAVIGSDGAGKSTLCADLNDWLRYKLDAHLLYMGSGDGRTGWLNGVRRKASNYYKKSKVHKNTAAKQAPSGFFSRAYRLFDLLLMRRKIRLLRRGRNMAESGSIILTDRYPQDQVMAISDGPRLQEAGGFPGRRVRKGAFMTKPGAWDPIWF